ncbi:MAG: hypothetical protein ACTHVE_11540 [Senegalia sp. (in: firmicutes)]|uniref:hypothetical protein n=1 Tax=Senegalia sp. (in: firmicutes) TaxID=1924098 RepID=UPI003F9DA15D
MSKLFGQRPLVVDVELAKIIGLNEAMVIQQIHYWLEVNKSKNINYHEDKHWTYNSMSNWHKQFPFWSIETVKRTFKSLRDKNLLLTGNFNKLKIDRTIWYTINYPELEKIMGITKEQNEKCQNEPMENSKMNSPLPEISTEIKNKNNKSISQSNTIVTIKKESIEKEIKEERRTDRFDYNDFNNKYKKILKNSYIDHIDDSYKDAVRQAIRLLVLDGMNKDKINISGNFIPRRVFNLDIEKINQFVVEHAINKFKKISRITKIKNTISYLKICIYNAIYERKIDVEARLRYEGIV